jgi:hypothetical protein
MGEILMVSMLQYRFKMNEVMILLILVAQMVMESMVSIEMLILGLIDNHLMLIESPKSKWLTDEE